MLLKIIAFLLIVAGAVISYGAKFIVEKRGLAQKVKVEEAQEMNSEELEKYRHAKAMTQVKLLGLAIMLPGVVLVFWLFR